MNSHSEDETLREKLEDDKRMDDEIASRLAEEPEIEKQELGRNMGELEKEVKDMVEEMDHIEALNQTQIVRERKGYYGSQKDRKQFFNADEIASRFSEEREIEKQQLGRNIGELEEEVKDMEEEMDDIEALNQTQIVRERKSYYELQKACKKFINTEKQELGRNIGELEEVKDMEEEMDDIEAPNQTHTIRERKSYYESQKACKNFINADENASSLAEECEIEKQKLGISIGELEEVNDMGEEMDDIEVLNQTLIVREQKSYYKSQEARKESLNADEIASWLAEEPEIRKAGTGRKKGELENEVKDVEMEMDDMELEIEQNRGTIQVMKHMEEENVEVQEKMDAIMEEIKEKEGKMDDIEVLNQTLFVQEQKSNDELQETCKDLINADEMASRLAGHEEQNENLHRKIIELQKELDTKQALELDIKEMRGTIQMMKHVVEENMEFKEKMDAMEELNQALNVKERESNDELQDARKELINSLKEGSTRAIIGVRRMGDLDGKPFLAAAKAKFPTEEAEGKAVELCSLWEDYLRDPRWHPFKVVVDEKGNCKEVVDVEDERLKNLKDEYGERVLNAVTLALTEMNVYNPSGRYTVPELWNFRENRRATVKEGVSHVIRQLKGNKRKRN